jgi:signal transduction histidine kinase
MRPSSLAGRLIVAAILWSVATLLIAGFILTGLYRQTVVSAFDERLSVYLRTLVGVLAAENPQGELADPGNLGEQRFELLFSGWYWQVRDEDGGAVVLASRSLFGDELDLTKATDVHTNADGAHAGALVGPTGQSLRVLSRPITFATGRVVDITVAGDAGEIAAEVAAFTTSVVLTLAALGAGLIVATFILIRWGLRPLDRVRQALADLGSGKQARISGTFPAEISPLVKELNALLQTNQQVIDRARTQVGNLAHALKTPLSVILNEARATRDPIGAKVAEQATLMHRQVSHHLDRARIAAKVNVIGASIEVAPVVARLARAMQRIYGDRGIVLAADVPEEARFRGEQQDLEEIVGNLADNACKWCRHQVSVSGEYTPPKANGDYPGRLLLRIDDDGPGLTEAEITEAGMRGKRLDESKPGSGLGLSIVADLVALYRGETRFSRSPAGGLRVEVLLPAA